MAKMGARRLPRIIFPHVRAPGRPRDRPFEQLPQPPLGAKGGVGSPLWTSHAQREGLLRLEIVEGRLLHQLGQPLGIGLRTLVLILAVSDRLEAQNLQTGIFPAR